MSRNYALSADVSARDCRMGKRDVAEGAESTNDAVSSVSIQQSKGLPNR